MLGFPFAVVIIRASLSALLFWWVFLVLMSKNVDDIMLYVDTEAYAFCKCLPADVLAFLSRSTAMCVFFFYWEKGKKIINFKYFSNINACVTI